MYKKIIQRCLDYPKLCLLTPNKRLSRYLQRDIEASYQEQGLNNWPTPHCLPWQTWLMQLFNQCQLRQLTPVKCCLSNLQRELIWKKIIHNDASTEHLIDVDQLSHLALKAWDVVNLWEIESGHLQQAFLSSDQQAFLGWMQRAKEEYSKNNYIDNSQLATFLRQHIESMPSDLQQVLLPREILCFAFDEMPPAEQRCLAALEKAGCQVEHLEATFIDTPTYQYAAPTTNEEIFTMALWAKQTAAANPHATIACIVPNLQQNRRHIEQIITEVFTPESCLIQAQADTLAVNISGGVPLAQTAIIQAALSWLRFAYGQCPVEQFSSLLRLPYQTHGLALAFKRAKLDRQLRHWGNEAINLSSFIRWQHALQSSEGRQADDHLLQACVTIEQQQAALPKKQSHEQWCEHFQTTLTTLGWPGDVEITSLQYQRCQHWQQALLEFAQCDQIEPLCDAQTALSRLQHCASNLLFQAQTEDTPVQVLGLLEAAGIRFDYVWIMGANNQTFPQAANPNPLLPYTLQQQLHCPHASPERELQFAQRILARYRQSTQQQCVLSYSGCDEDQEYQASYLLAGLPMLTKQINKPVRLTKQIFERRITETLRDDIGPAITSKQKLLGGSQVLVNYSACYFRGFALHRLGAQTIQPFAPLFSPLRRGLYCHSAMEWFWQDVRNWQTLQDLTAAQRQDKIKQAIQFAFARHFADRLPKKFQHILAVEEQCLQHILEQWLDKESERKPFQVEHTEQALDITLGHCQLTTRIDRVDKTMDGSTIIIDYKTGKPSLQAWFGERPDDPQLPLYALASEMDVRGILFAKLRAEELAYIGLTEHEETIKGIKSVADLKEYQDWPDVLRSWKESLDLIVHNIEVGSAQINPKYKHQTCANCECQTLCRIQEKGGENELAN